jgi:DNA mismatch endonuclease (patch repair protein)
MTEESRRATSERMRRVRSKDTAPEMRVRRLVHGLGYRYRLHAPDLPGTPDLVFRGRKKVIFVHGCYWHRHPGCKRASTPRERRDYWQAKFDRNVARDTRNLADLRAEGWDALVVWECELKDEQHLRNAINNFLGLNYGKG